jgi:polar amino acid transport system substrate-binding protein
MRLAALLGAVVILAACGGGATPTPQPVASGPTPTIAPTQAATAAPTPVAAVPADQLLFAGKLTVCSDMPYEPFEYFDAQGDPIGSDIEIADGIATRLGLKLVVVNSVFDTIFVAPAAGKCDIIVSDTNITPGRLSLVDMVPYQQVKQAVAVLKGNPGGINTELDMCGKKVAAETGTTEQGYLEGADLYKESGGLKKKCADAGKAAPNFVPFQKDSDAFLALTAHQVDAYFADEPVVDNFLAKQPDQYEKPAISIPAIKVGIGVPKPDDAHKATSSGYTALADAVKTALVSMVNDGTYLTILQKYKVDAGAIQASDVVIDKF